MKLQILDKFGNPFRLKNPKNIIVSMPYMEDRILRKSLVKNQIRIVDADNGKVDVVLSQFDIDGLNQGRDQSFAATIEQGDKKYDVRFERALHVDMVEGKKSIYEEVAV